MTDTEIIEAIIANRMWVHPAGGFLSGWTASEEKSPYYMFAHNRPTLRQAVKDALAMKAMHTERLAEQQ